MQIVNHRHLFYQGCRVRVKELSATAKKRLDILERYADLRAHGYTEQEALTFLETKRSTLYVWQKRYRKKRLEGLEPHSRRPWRERQSKVSLHIKQRVCHIRKQFPMWGRDKIAVLLGREGMTVSPSTVGRILKNLMDRNVIKPVPVLKAERLVRRKRHFTKHAKRWIYGTKAKVPGEMIQIDHMSVTTSSQMGIKHFQATCPLTKITVTEAYINADSKTAARFLEKVIAEMPFPIKSIQVDGGSEFMKDFESLCAIRQIPLHVLPPRSPKLNGNVERTNGTFRYEFYHSYDLGYSLGSIRNDLKSFNKIYNFIRPHKALDYQTPMQYYDKEWLKIPESESRM
jgi:transposase InsO family protein